MSSVPRQEHPPIVEAFGQKFMPRSLRLPSFGISQVECHRSAAYELPLGLRNLEGRIPCYPAWKTLEASATAAPSVTGSPISARVASNADSVGRT